LRVPNLGVCKREGTHQRTIIDYGRFMERLKEKSASIGR